MGDACIRQIRDIDEALSRLNPQVRELREKKKAAQERLYKWMVSHHLETFEGVSRKKIAPRPKIVRKKEAEKKRDAIQLFQSVGVNDPGELWEEFKRSQAAPRASPTD
jgi:hypothetical protein